MRRYVVFLSLITCTLASGWVARGQEQPAAAARRDVDAALSADRGAQQSQSAWETERSTLRARHDGLVADVTNLERGIARDSAVVAALEARMAELQHRLVEADRLTDNLEDTLVVLLDRLVDEVDADLPFLPAERRQRLATLREELFHPDTPAAEKLRRLLEAYQIEASYGGTVELVTDAIDLDGHDVHVEILRVGRLALFWRTPDGARSGAWDPANQAWITLDRRHHRALGQAFEMAARRRPVQIIGLPIGRIEP
ncbi:hypothetical protein DRQ50_02090 [bacterium]|nr:MAG: hypothetical protein DRQ50_02090 [bacterium]